MITTISNIVNSGGSPAALLPDQITNLACVGGTDGVAGTIDVSFTEVPATSFDLLKYYILVYKENSIPQTPFDGTRITLQKGTAGVKLEHKITGLTFDQLYGVRIYPVSVKNQYQTLAEGSTATVTPVAGIRLDSLMAGVEVDRIKLPDSNIVYRVLQHNYSGSNSTLIQASELIRLIFWGNMYYENSPLDAYLNSDDFISNYISSKILSKITSVNVPVLGENGEISTINRKFFILSARETGYPGYGGGEPIAFFNTGAKRVLKFSSVPQDYWTRSVIVRAEDEKECRILTSEGARELKYTRGSFYLNFVFCLPGNTVFNTEPDEDGCYTLL